MLAARIINDVSVGIVKNDRIVEIKATGVSMVNLTDLNVAEGLVERHSRHDIDAKSGADSDRFLGGYTTSRTS